MLKIITCLFFLLFSIQAHAQPERTQLLQLIADLQRASHNNSDSFDYYYKHALPLAVKLKDMASETKIQETYGMKLFLQGQSDKATTIMLDAVRRAEQFPLTEELAILYYAVAQVYSKNEYGDIGVSYLKKGISVAISVNSNTAMGDGYNRIGIAYERRGNMDSALYFYEQSLHVNEQDSTLRLGEAYSLENIAGIYGQRNDMATALKYQKRALALKLKVGRPIDHAMIYINIAETFNGMKKYDSAIFYAQKALKTAEEINYQELVKFANQFLSGIYEVKGEYKKALDFNKRYSALNDSILTERKAAISIEADKKYQTEKRLQRIMELSQRTTIQNLQIKQRSQLLYFISALFIVAVIAAGLFYNRRKLKAEARLQAEINRQQANTTREVLNAEEKERKRIAADLHDGVGQMLSASLMNLNGFFAKKNIDKSNDPDADRIMSLVTESYDELRAISHQMMPKALTKSGLESAVQELVSGIDHDKLAVTFDSFGLSGRLDEGTETLLYRVIQESVNNVIKHADAKTLDIQISRDDDGVFLTIEDDGNGFDPATIKKSGIGLKNIYSRVQLQNGNVDIDSRPGKGTLIAIHLPA